MSDDSNNIKRYYSAARLSPDAINRCLSVASHARRRQMIARIVLAAAAMLVISAGIGIHRFVSRTSIEDVEKQVSGFFERPDARLDFASENPTLVRQWLKEQGGPQEFAIPPGLAGKPTAGCEILGHAGGRIFVVCFVSGEKLTAADKADSQSPGSAHPPGIVHLVLIPKSPLAEILPPRSQARVVNGSKWSYAAWNEGALDYLLVTDAGNETLRQALDV